ncbi:hypothetical protein SNA67_11120 [Escherichia coli]|nr:hypothetical protein [Escherichia coli]
MKRTIETLAKNGVIRLPQIEVSERINNLGFNVQYEHYVFEGEQGKRDSIVVVAQLSPEFTARLVDRWRELEETAVVDIQAHLVTVDQRLDGVESDVSDIKSDYVSKTVTESQSLASPLDVKTSYSVDGIQVVGARQTGWTAATGTPLLGSFNANQSYTVGTTYTQSEVADLATGLQQARQRILALETALRLHGLID